MPPCLSDGPVVSDEAKVTALVTNDAVDAYPTDQRARRMAQGHAANNKPQVLEDHHEDCGEDFGPLGEEYFAYDPFDPNAELVSDSEDEVCCLVNLDHGLNGSTFEPDEQQYHSDANYPMYFDDLESFTTWNESKVVNDSRSPHGMSPRW